MSKKTIIILIAIFITAVIVWSAINYYPGMTRQNQSMIHSDLFKTPITGNADDIKKGRVLYAQNCAVCHGASAQGQIPSKKSGGTDENGVLIAPALDYSAHAWHHPDSVIFDYIKNGSPEKTSPMIGHGDKLNDDDIIKIIIFIKSMWTPEIREMHAKMGR